MLHNTIILTLSNSSTKFHGLYRIFSTRAGKLYITVLPYLPLLRAITLRDILTPHFDENDAQVILTKRGEKDSLAISSSSFYREMELLSNVSRDNVLRRLKDPNSCTLKSRCVTVEVCDRLLWVDRHFLVAKIIGLLIRTHCSLKYLRFTSVTDRIHDNAWYPAITSWDVSPLFAKILKVQFRNCCRTRQGQQENFLSGPWSAGDGRSRQRGRPEEQKDNRHSTTALPRYYPGEQSCDTWMSEKSCRRPGPDWHSVRRSIAGAVHKLSSQICDKIIYHDKYYQGAVRCPWAIHIELKRTKNFWHSPTRTLLSSIFFFL